ncbi:MAG: hypothetical protein ABI649_03865 [Gaiellaceae bacterium]
MGRNEALFREINEYIADVSRALPASEEFEILCECARLNCVEKIGITKDAYATARAGGDTFIVLPGHHLPEVERVVGEVNGSLLVEKMGEARAGVDQVEEGEQASGGHGR